MDGSKLNLRKLQLFTKINMAFAAKWGMKNDRMKHIFQLRCMARRNHNVIRRRGEAHMPLQ